MRLKNYLTELNIKVFFPQSRKTDKEFAGLIAHILHGQLITFGYDERQNQNFVKVNKVRGISRVDQVVDRLHAQDIEANFAIRESRFSSYTALLKGLEKMPEHPVWAVMRVLKTEARDAQNPAWRKGYSLLWYEMKKGFLNNDYVTINTLSNIAKSSNIKLDFDALENIWSLL